ncbi:hypothetical protein SAMN02745673_02611 [Marinactinospora thermotolerans DSM 45154]|uniref:Uncharacterized protein n=1 Tax=Marinactinospora thermotolerans DSM 45154 TaxID=1122192 RepID=A0A1T4R8H6_9ACTN|nr:hypothetical protein SAMN02745673_02611 [Marinactinospora thermotolerans DSM 45154]
MSGRVNSSSTQVPSRGPGWRDSEPSVRGAEHRGVSRRIGLEGPGVTRTGEGARRYCSGEPAERGRDGSPQRSLPWHVGRFPAGGARTGLSADLLSSCPGERGRPREHGSERTDRVCGTGRRRPPRSSVAAFRLLTTVLEGRTGAPGSAPSSARAAPGRWSHRPAGAASRRGRREHAPAAHLEAVPRGGLNLWGRLPDTTDPPGLVEECERAGVVVAPGDEWFPAEPTGPRLRPDYAGPNPGAFPMARASSGRRSPGSGRDEGRRRGRRERAPFRSASWASGGPGGPADGAGLPGFPSRPRVPPPSAVTCGGRRSRWSGRASNGSRRSAAPPAGTTAPVRPRSGCARVAASA